jgi:L-ascorbate metabolism protein UlaG (beta-lactamase superfamily)
MTAARERVSWLGHATALIELGPLAVLTDPVLRGRVAHLRRHVPPADTPDRLDAVLLSHLHRDHADGPSLRLLPPDVPVIVPAGAAGVVRRLGVREVIELRAGESLPLRDATVTAVPAEHEGRRSPLHSSVPALGFVVERGTRVYFAGDTDLFDGMAELAPLDVALLPIWGWGGSLGPGHLDPRAAARAVALLRPRVVVPIHWGTYLPLGYRAGHPLLHDPGRKFAEHVAELAPDTRVELLLPGGSLDL